ncbi:MAG: M14 family metallopeptidase [Bacteroidales bacterium]
MKRLRFFITMVLVTAGLAAQDYKPLNEIVWPESDDNDTVYTVKGYRHGISFFPQVKHDEVEYVAGDELTFDRYHSNDVINTWMSRWAEQYPDLVDLYQVAESFEGRPILQMTITNKKTGAHTDKPASFFEGNRHSGEITSSESVMWLADHLLGSYGKDDEITELLDNYTFYLRPVNNPDGHNLYVHTAQSNRSTVRPTDNDLDGLLDEDSPDDINGDGVILSMRWKDSENGNYIIDPDDPSGRIMKRVEEGEGDYRVQSEGIDNDGDGRINEDGIGGLDLHRNYPENWRPERHKEATGRGFTQYGAGEYPLSETETRSVVTFLLSHPNVYIVNSMDTRVPMHLRPPSTSPSEERMYEEDLEWYEYFDEKGKEITGYERAGDVYQDYGGGRPLFGHGPDFGYWYYGAIWYGDELWNGARFKDYDGDDDIDQLDLLRWDEEENDGDGFIEWTEAQHPDYGTVEIGGFHPKFFSQNAPAKHLLPWAKNQALFNLEMVKHLPRLEWGDIDIKRIKSYKKDSVDYRVTVEYHNSGKLPTALRQAHLVKIVQEDKITVSFDRGLTEGEEPVIRILRGDDDDERSRYYRGSRGPASSLTLDSGYAEGESSNSSEFTIRVYKDVEVSGKASVSSTRGGILEKKEFVIK